MSFAMSVNTVPGKANEPGVIQQQLLDLTNLIDEPMGDPITMKLTVSGIDSPNGTAIP